MKWLLYLHMSVMMTTSFGLGYSIFLRSRPWVIAMGALYMMNTALAFIYACYEEMNEDARRKK